MLKNKISILSFLILSSGLMVACGNKEEIKEDATIEKTEEIKEVEVLRIEKQEFKTLAELKSFSQTKSKEFENVLKSNKIDFLSSPDSTLVINKDMTYEKYTKAFNQLTYIQTTMDYESGSGYLKTGLKLNLHMQEQTSIDNNIVHAMYDVIKLYNKNISIDEFNTEIKNATSSPDDITDKDITTGVEGIVLKVYSKPDVNERELVLSIRQELSVTPLTNILKEYKTVKEFKEDSLKLSEIISEKVDKLNEVLKNSYIGKYKEIGVETKNIVVNDSSQFSQSLDVEYKGVGITGLQDEMISGLYELIETVISKENLSKIITLDEFKNYVRGLEIYSGAYSNGVLVDEIGDAIEPNTLPFLSEVGLSISFTPAVLEQVNTDETTGEGQPSSANVYDSNIKVSIYVPVKAEGITSL